jgi:D-alanine-D-alanine ligase
MHGTYGEDGNLQGYLETVGIPYAESDTYASVVGQDKVFMKQIWKESMVPVVKYDWFFDTDYNKNPDKIIERLEKMGYPLIVKPARLGSSVGITIAHNNSELSNAISDAINYDTEKQFQRWRLRVYNPKTGKVGYAEDFKTNAVVKEYSPSGDVVRTWQLEGCWPSSVEYGDLTYEDANEKQISVTIMYDKAYRTDIADIEAGLPTA